MFITSKQFKAFDARLSDVQCKTDGILKSIDNIDNRLSALTVQQNATMQQLAGILAQIVALFGGSIYVGMTDWLNQKKKPLEEFRQADNQCKADDVMLALDDLDNRLKDIDVDDESDLSKLAQVLAQIVSQFGG